MSLFFNNYKKLVRENKYGLAEISGKNFKVLDSMFKYLRTFEVSLFELEVIKKDLIGLAKQVEERLRDCKKPIKVAVMGCIVNGPGEAKEADIGVAGGDGNGLIFKKGEILRKVPEDKLLDELMKEIDKL